MMLLMYKKNQVANCSMLLICLALYICGAANTNVEAAAMLRPVQHHQDSVPSSRELDQIEDTKAATPEWPDDDDDDDMGSIQNKQIVDHTENDSTNAENATSKLDNDETAIVSTQQASVGQDNGGEDEEIIPNEIIDSSENQEHDESNVVDTEKVVIENEDSNVDNTTLVMGEEIPSTEYHRSQSTVQNEAPADSTGETRSFAQSDNVKPTHNDQESENINTGNGNIVDNEINDGSDAATFEESGMSNANIVDGSVPPLDQVDPQQQPPPENTFVNYNEDEEEESFFAMIQSTLQVLFLAAFFSLGLVFRRRVLDRMSDHPSLNVSHAMQEEAIKVVTDLATWLSESRNDSNNIGGGYSMPTIVERGSSVRGSGSSRAETIPLATATDEEWGWDDEDVGGNLELSGVGGDNSNEEDDLAMAIAMSLSEPVKGGGSEIERPVDLVRKNSSSAPVPAPTIEVAVEKSSNDELNQHAPPADTIEDLLGHMSSAGGPVISSFGQKATKIEPKSKPKTTRNDTEDIFASMGLSSFPSTKTGPPQQQRNTSSSTLLKAESIDESDDWGDDGDLDDLLLED
mmetsp:Transcript_22185/g.44583  ORF Transcript_22185/g.44583 Transcript_22185/m.44583 type:complete len:574 (-) Transcript_22185:95-1816(-)